MRSLLESHLAPGHALWLAAVVLGLDYVTGPLIHFPILFVLPTVFAAWYGGVRWGIVFAVLLPAFRIGEVVAWNAPWTWPELLVNSAIYAAVLAALAALTTRLASATEQLSREVHMLRGILPICAYCKKIRDSGGDWHQMEMYIARHSEASFSHGICPSCLHEHFPDPQGPTR